MEPYSLEAEKSVLGSILLDPAGAIPQVIDVIVPDDFYIAGHGIIYREMLDLYATTNAVDYVTVTEKLKDSEISDVPIKDYMLELAQWVPSIANAKAYAKIVKGWARARKARNILLDATAAEISAENVDTITEDVMSRLFGMTAEKRSTGLQPLKSVVPEWYCNLFKKGAQRRVDTGYGDFDTILNGLWGDELIVLAARPSVGKTAFALSIAENAARAGNIVNVFSCEMNKSQLIGRMVATESGVNLSEIINAEQLVKDRDKVGQIAQSVDTLHKLPINVCDDAAITAEQIQAQSRMTKNLGLIIVDYIQLMKATGKSKDRNEEVGSISRALKLTAKSLGVPVLALSQLNREVEHRTIQRPCMSDLRDSGALEQDADKIIFGWKPDPEKNIVEFDVAKNRNGGPTGTVQFIFDGAHMAYHQLVKSDYIKPKKSRSGIQYDNEF